MSIGQKKTRGRSGRTSEKVGNREHRPEEIPREKRTNQRKSRKSWALARRKPAGGADESEKKQEIVSIGQKKYCGCGGRTSEKAGNHEHRPEEILWKKRTNQNATK